MILEVIACSVADAIEAERGGAHRLEIVREIAKGGLTPSFALVRDILDSVALPVRVMLREQESYEVSDGDEAQKLCNAAFAFSQFGVDGLVLGFLKSNKVDLELTARVLSCAPALKATFHHAFEEVDPFEAIRDLKKLRQVDRVLTFGGKGDWPEKAARLVQYQRKARPELELVVGGGLDTNRIRLLSQTTGVNEFHVGLGARQPATVEGVVQAGRVRSLVAAMHHAK